MACSATPGMASLRVTAPAEAVGTHYPFCIQGDEYPGLSGCSFTSYEQCQATASGRFLYCMANPYYKAGGPVPRARHGRRPVRYVYPAY